MLRRRTPRSLTDTRAVLDSRGEIAVGAYARQQRRRRALVGLLGVGLIGGAVWLYLALAPEDGPAPARSHPVAVQCVTRDCGYRAVVMVPRGEESFPRVCPRCGQHSCYRLWECRDCGRQFLLSASSGALVCPGCGSERVGGAEELRVAEAGAAADPQGLRGNGR